METSEAVNVILSISDYIDLDMLGEMLEVGTLGFVAGVIIPFGFRLIGYVVDSIRVVLGKE